jgi:hypothetical protein
MRKLHGTLALLVLVLGTWAVVDASTNASAVSGPGFPNWENTGPQVSGQGFTVAFGAAPPTDAEVKGRIQTHTHGVAVTGSASLQQQKHHQAYIENAEHWGNWKLEISGGIRARAFVEDYVGPDPNTPTHYKADAHGKIMVQWVGTSGDWTVEDASATRQIENEEQAMQTIGDQLNNQAAGQNVVIKTRLDDDSEYKLSVLANGNMDISRGEPWVNSEAFVEHPIAGTLTAYDGPFVVFVWQIE